MTDEESTALARRFDHTSEEMMRSPWDMFSTLRNRCPVAHSSQHGGFYIATTYDAVMQIESNWKVFSSDQGVAIPPQPYRVPPVESDPPRHTEFRRLLNPLFTTKAVQDMRGRIQTEVHSLIDGFIVKGQADIVTDLLHPLMSAVVLPILGVPTEDLQKVNDWVHHILFDRADDPANVQRCGMELSLYLRELARCKRDEPADDTTMIGRLVNGKINDQPISDDDIAGAMTVSLFGGLDTSSGVLAEAILFLSRHPEEKRKLRDGAYDWSTAVEEFVRISSPLVGLRRVLTEDAEVAGTQLRKGDSVFALFVSANRDEKQFPDADQCLLDRKPNRHVGFGSYIHICLGRNLARVEIEIVLRIVLERLYDLVIPADFVPEYWAGEARGMKSLPATFTPGRRCGGG
ncbi:MAG: cytochrome P450 [Steroidobacteraceae bacterium]